MAVLFRSRSGKALLFFDDEGRGFVTSVSWVKGLIDGTSPRAFVQLKALPVGVPKDKFVVSPTLDLSEVALGSRSAKKADAGIVVGDVGEW